MKIFRIVFILILSSAGLVNAAPVRAAGVVGTGTPTSCTAAALTAAVIGGGLVTFNCGPVPHTITLGAQFTLITNTTIDGGGLVTLSGGDATRHAFINSGVNATFKNITLTNGYSAVGGGALEIADAQVTLDNTRLILNTALEQGGAVYCFIGTGGALTVTNSLIEGNVSKRGGGIFNDGCRLTLSNSVVARNTVTRTTGGSGTAGLLGGGVFNAQFGVARITGTRFERNAGFDGGALHVAELSSAAIDGATFVSNTGGYGGAIESSGTTTVTNSRFDGNAVSSLGGAIWVLNGQLVLSRSVLVNNNAVDGGALHVQTPLTDSVTLRDVTFAGNRASRHGGAIFTGGDLFLTNGTLSGNHADNLGGALYSEDKASLKFVTIAYNESLAGALYGESASRPEPVYAQATLLVSNTNGSCGGVIVSVGDGNNVSDSASCGGVFTQPGDKNNAATPLGPLQDNGGGTPTHLPLPGNIAIDLFTPSAALASCQMQDASAPADQRGIARPQNSKCDAGAVERRAEDAQRRVWMPLLQVGST
jgi:predicted outer membrane repeat protein